jgi:serine/threonine protein kinase
VRVSDELEEQGVVDRVPPPWGAEITPFTEVCGGQYVLLHELARGDLSIVYRAKPAGSRDTIAFKVIQPRYMGNETQVRRFRREAELLKRIEHPNVVRLIDHGTIEDGRDFLALELLTGRTLADALAKATRMSPERTCRIARQVARALRAMHKAGVIHRDLRPENILLIGPEDAERVKLVDLSDAGDVGAPAQRVKDQTGKGASGPKGEGTYRAPEQVRKRPPHPSMDVFALGVIMYEMLAGEHPFARPKAAKLGGHTIRTKAFDAPEVLLGLVADCIERSPDDRPRTMDDVLDRIDKALLWMGVVPHEVPGDEGDEDRRTQLWAAADGKPGASRRPAREPLSPRAEAPRAAPEEEDLEFDLEDEPDEALPTERRELPPSVRTRKPWELVSTGAETEPREAPRRPVADPAATRRAREEAEHKARRAREEDEKARRAREDDEKARRAREEAEQKARRAREEAEQKARRAREEEEKARRAREEEKARRAREEEKLRAQEQARRAQEEIRRAQEEARRAQEEARRAQEEARRAQEEARRERERGRRGDGSTTGSVPRIDLDDLRERERASRDSSSGSMPRIDPNDLDEGAPTGPRFVVDTVAWTKQQPSAEPVKGRKQRVATDASGDRSRREGEPAAARASTSDRVPGNGSPSSPRSERTPRPPTAVHQPVDALPRWLLPLLVMVLLALAYAVYLVWTQ